MVLSDRDIERELDEGDLVIEPLDDEQIQPASVDLRLDSGTKFYEKQSEPIRVDRNDAELTESTGNGEILFPAESACLASTRESIHIPDYLSAELKGRSSIGRLMLHIHTAGWCDPGWHGDDVTLEIINHNPNDIILPEGMRVCQIVFDYLHTPARNEYFGKYNEQSGPTESRIHEDSEFHE